MTHHRLTVPPAFYDDHVDRGCPAGVVVARTAKGVKIEMDDAELADLLSDAEHYVESGTAELGNGFVGLVASARATIDRINQAWPADQRPDAPPVPERVVVERVPVAKPVAPAGPADLRLDRIARRDLDRSKARLAELGATYVEHVDTGTTVTLRAWGLDRAAVQLAASEL